MHARARTNGFAGGPPEFPFAGFVVDWDASIRSSITDDGTNALTWTDQVSGFVATKPPSQNGPLVDDETRNGLHALTFKRFSQLWLVANQATSLGNASYTVEFVFRMGDYASVGSPSFTCMGGFHTAAGGNSGAIFPNLTGRCDFSGGTGIGLILDHGALEPNTWHTMMYTATAGASGNVTTYLDGINVTVHVGDPTSDIAGTFSIGQDFDSATPTDFYEGAIGQLRIWNRALSAAEVSFVQQQSMAKWALLIAPYPYNFIFDTRWWLDAAQTITKIGGVPLIFSMFERSNNELSFTGTDNLPANIPNELNSLPVIRMAGLADFDLPDSTHPVADNNFTFIMLVRMRTEVAGQSVFITAGTGGTLLSISRVATDTLEMDFGGSLLKGTTLDDDWHTISATYDNTVGRKIYVDDFLVASDATTGINTGTTLHRIGLSSAQLDMDFAEGVCLNTVFSLPDIITFRDYLLDKWFASLTFDADTLKMDSDLQTWDSTKLL